MDEELQELLDKQAINEVIQRISRTMDWLDDEGQASCYWPDAAIDFGFFVGRADAFVPFVMEHE
ncbi:MAG: nuclear transport factor 2 family protein, partial [bacterium]|nr:nuclear transport factor 2 family protein [bacterium]